MKKLIFVKIFILALNYYSFPQSIPVILPNFPIVLDSLDYTYNNGPIVADFNSDGENEILIGVNVISSIGKVLVVDSNGGLFKNFPKNVSCFSSYIWIAAGDVDNNGTIDIVAKSDSLYVFDYLGNSLSGFPMYLPIPTNDLGDKIALYDFDNDGKLEIVLARSNVITIVNHNGSIRNGWPITVNLGNHSHINMFSIGDLNSDNISEILIPCVNTRTPLPPDSSFILILEPDGTQYFHSPIISDSGYSYDIWNYPIIYKNNNQMHFSILSSYSSDLMPNNYKSRFTVYDQSGQIEERSCFISYLAIESLTMGKLNNSEPFFLGGDIRYTHGFSSDGSFLPGYPLLIESYQLRNHNIGKLTNNPCFVSTATQDTLGGKGLRGYVKAWDISGSELSWSPLRPLGIPGTAPSFCDLNNDGQAELVATTNSYFNGSDGCALYIWTLPGVIYSRENFPLPMWGHDRYRTNQFGFIPPDDPVGIDPINTAVVSSIKLYQNFPNPFNPTTTIKFDISSNRKSISKVTLKIYNVLGKEMETIVNEILSPGSYSVTFDGKNYASGVYFCTLRADQYSETKRFLLVK